MGLRKLAEPSECALFKTTLFSSGKIGWLAHQGSSQGDVSGSSEGVWGCARGNGTPKDMYSRLQELCGNVRKSTEMTGNGTEISGNGREPADCKWAETAGGRVTCGAWESVLRVCCGMGHEGFAVLDLRNPGIFVGTRCSTTQDFVDFAGNGRKWHGL